MIETTSTITTGVVLRADGVELRLGRHVTAVSRDGGDYVLSLADGSVPARRQAARGHRRCPRVADLGPETVGVDPGRGGIPVDARMRAGDSLWAIGDVTGPAPSR